MTPRAMILAAGFGTRLAELGGARPKPMLPVVGAPLVRWAVLFLRHHGIREIVVNLHHLGEQIEAELGDGSALGVAIAYSREHGQILGTGGGLRQARPLLDDGKGTPIVVMNGKVLVDLDLDEVLAFHRSHDAEATMVVRSDAQADRWGSQQLAADGRIVRLLGRTPVAEAPAPVSAPMMFTGIHVFQPHFLDRVPPEGEQCIIRTAYRSLFDAGSGLYGFATERYWWEHSTPERYLQGICNALDGAVPLPFAESFVRGVSPSAVIEAGARIVEPVRIAEGVRIGTNAVIGPHVQLERDVVVDPGVRMQRAVVWRGRVQRDATDVVLPDGTP
jgi:mannose-1-phosphate guanylyltransferase